MSNTTLSVKSADNAGITYANPTKPDLTVRFKSSTNQKVLNGVSTANYSVEVIVNDNNSITVGGVAALDALSVRLRVSGSLASKNRLRQLLVSAAAQLGTWETENVFQGFRPTTAPVILETF